jgi:hypothetical protein
MTKRGMSVNKFSDYKKVSNACLELRAEGTTLETDAAGFIHHKNPEQPLVGQHFEERNSDRGFLERLGACKEDY